ncbi:MAG: EAL domain-containing protein [Pseudomonadota bacterium]
MDNNHEAVLLAAGIARWMYHPASGELELSESGRQLLDVQVDDVSITLELINAFRVPDGSEPLHSALQELERSPGTRVVEFRVDLPDRGIRWLRAIGCSSQSEKSSELQISGILMDVTVQRRAEQLHEAFFNQPNGMHMIASLDGVIELVNDEWADCLGIPKDELVGQSLLAFLHEDDQELAKAKAQGLKQGIGSFHLENRLRHRDGSYRLLSWSFTVSQDEHFMYAVARDITEERDSQNRLTEAAAVFDHSGEGICVIDLESNVLDVNEAFSRITGYPRDEALKMNTKSLRSGRHDEAFYEALEEAVTRKGFWRGEIWNRNKGGEVHPHLLTLTQIDSEPPRRVAILTDIRQLKATEARLQQLAHFDPLTGLANRYLINEKLEQSLRRAKRSGRGVAVVFVDVDAFKNVNDSLGHLAGDRLLQEVAKRLAQTLRAADSIGRIGGDEFLLVLEDVGSSRDVSTIAEKLNASLRLPMSIADQDFSVSGSLGISMYPEDGLSAQELMRNADAAMYDAKEHGRDTYRFYSEQLTKDAYRQVLLDSALREAQARQELALVFQPQFDVEKNRLIGVEALLRWHHPQLGSVSPAQFIPHAERTGLIRSIGQWVLENSCRQGAHWQAKRHEFGTIAVNVSASQFHDESFVEQVKLVLAETGLAPTKLELEITEGVLAQDTHGLIEKMQILRSLGVRFSVDDFGTGYSSLSFLKKMPIDRLKLDRSFVEDVATDESNKIIASAVIALGDAMGLEVVAEGVETKAQESVIMTMGCQKMQGFLYGKPMSGEEVEEHFGHAQEGMRTGS